MSREVRRVPLNFDFPVGDTWTGYLTPDELHLPTCTACDSRGYSPRAQYLHDLWYGNVPFKPEDNGSTPLTADTPAVRAFAERNVQRAPEFYVRPAINWSNPVRHEADIARYQATPEVERVNVAIFWEAQRLADLWNGQWGHHLNAEDVAALVAGDRLWDLTKRWVEGDGWQPIDPPVTVTPEQVNEWAIRTTGHDSINAAVCVRARVEREGTELCCATCGGEGNVATDEQRAALEAWEPTPPPTGDGYQLWQTVSEGGPVSPVFATPTELADWIIASGEESHGADTPRDALIRWVAAGGSSIASGAVGPAGSVSGVKLAATLDDIGTELADEEGVPC